MSNLAEFDKWANEYGLRYEPNYSAHTLADVLAAWKASRQIEVTDQMVINAISAYNKDGFAFMTLDRADIRAMRAALTAVFAKLQD